MTFKQLQKSSNRQRDLNHLVRKGTLGHLAKLAKGSLQAKWLWARILLQSLKLQIPRLFQTSRSLTFKQP